MSAEVVVSHMWQVEGVVTAPDGVYDGEEIFVVAPSISEAMDAYGAWELQNWHEVTGVDVVSVVQTHAQVWRLA